MFFLMRSPASWFPCIGAHRPSARGSALLPGCLLLWLRGLDLFFVAAVYKSTAGMSAADQGARSGPTSGQVQQGLKETLVETLTAILSPVQEVRAAAEEQIKALEVTEGECGV